MAEHHSAIKTMHRWHALLIRSDLLCSQIAIFESAALMPSTKAALQELSADLREEIHNEKAVGS